MGALYNLTTKKHAPDIGVELTYVVCKNTLSTGKLSGPLTSPLSINPDFFKIFSSIKCTVLGSRLFSCGNIKNAFEASTTTINFIFFEASTS